MRVPSIRRQILLMLATTTVCLVGLGLARTASDEPAAPPNPVEDSPPNPAIGILRGLDKASQLYLDTALRFACQEKIVDQTTTSRRAYTFDYLYVYDDAHGYQDYRTRGAAEDRVDPRSLGIRQFLERASMWVLVFNRTRFEQHRYRLAGGDRMHGVQAVMVEFEPLPPYKEGRNDWFGTAWVDPATHQLLHVEAMKSDDHRRWEELKTGRRGTNHVTDWITEVVTDFEVVKNGMRFPSRATATSRRYLSGELPPKSLREARSTQTYSKYRFYGVRTYEEVRSLLGLQTLPGASPPSP
jgi:hypothetical protein